MEEQAEFIRCLDDNTVDRLFVATIIPVPLGEETSDCVQEGLDIIDPRAVMTAGLEGDAATAMGGSMAAFIVAVACLDDEEWTAAAPRLGMEPEDRDGMVCVMAALGGPTEMATAMTEAMAAEEESALFAAGLECGMEASPQTATQEPATETPTPTTTSTMEAATPTLELSAKRTTPTLGPTPSTTTTTPVITVSQIPGNPP